jgi:O-antigen/teichoic acid export membrane protein
MMSATLLGTVLACLLLLHRLGIRPTRVPIGALFLANAISLVVGLLLVGRRRDLEALERLRFGQLLRLGRWLMLVGLTPTAAAFVAAVLVTHLASATTLGYVQAVQVLSQPVNVLMVGLSAVLGPRLMQAGAERRVTLHVASPGPSGSCWWPLPHRTCSLSASLGRSTHCRIYCRAPTSSAGCFP